MQSLRLGFALAWLAATVGVWLSVAVADCIIIFKHSLYYRSLRPSQPMADTAMAGFIVVSAVYCVFTPPLMRSVPYYSSYNLI